MSFNILFVTDLYPIGQDYTIPRIVEDFALALKNSDCKITVIRPNFLLNTFLRHHKIKKQGEYEKNGIKIYNRNFILPYLRENSKFINSIKKESFDLIISHMPSGHIYTNLINKTLNLPHIAIIHYSDYRVLREFPYNIYFKKALQKALDCASIKGGRNKFLSDKLGCDFILPSFVQKDVILPEKKNPHSDKMKLVTLSQLIKRKNLNLVIEALACRNFDFVFDIYGEGRERKNLENLINKYSLQDKIKLKGRIEHKKVYETLDNYDIFILPSCAETFGVSYLEAMARGLITIASQDEGMEGIIHPKEDGFLIKPDIDNIENTLQYLNDPKNKEKRKEISRNTIENIQNFEKEKIINFYLEIISSLVFNNRTQI